MLRTASKWLSRQRDSFLSETVLYNHYGEDAASFEITVTRGRSIFKAENDYGITIRTYTADFLVSAEMIPVIPCKGDEIHCDGKRFEVLAPNNEPVWRWSDANQTTIRIHTKEIGEV